MKTLVAVPARSACLFLPVLLLSCGGSSDCVSGPLCADDVTVDGEAVLQPHELCSDFSATAIASFQDAALEAAIRAALSVDAQASLTCGLISGGAVRLRR